MNSEAGDFSPKYYVGTSGWTYDHWKGDFYPAKLVQRRWFDYYATLFNAVEVNATFYRYFRDGTYLSWKARAPQGFAYVLKAPQMITHRKFLRNVETDIQDFSRSAGLLGETFEMILLQVAPNQPHDFGLLRAALEAFPDPTRVAVEFRDAFWFTAETESLLSSLGAVFCNVDSPDWRLGGVLTSRRGYLRLHGRQRWYASDYSEAELEDVAGIARGMAGRGAREICIFFNNDLGGFAPRNALALQKMLASK